MFIGALAAFVLLGFDRSSVALRSGPVPATAIVRLNFPGHTDSITAIYPFADKLITVGHDKQARVWDVGAHTSKPIYYPVLSADPGYGGITASAFTLTPSGPILALATTYDGVNSEIYIVNPTSGKLGPHIQVPGGKTTAMTFSEKGDRLLIAQFGAPSSSFCSFDFPELKPLGKPEMVPVQYQIVQCFSAAEGNSTTFVSNDRVGNSLLGQVDIASAKLKTFSPFTGTLKCITKAPQGYLFGGGNGSFGLWKPGGSPVMLNANSRAEVEAIETFNHGSRAAIGLSGGTGYGLQIWDLSKHDPALLPTQSSSLTSISAIGVTNTGGLAVSMLPSGSLLTLDSNGGNPSIFLTAPSLEHIAWSGNQLCAAGFVDIGNDNAADLDRAFDLQTGQPTDPAAARAGATFGLRKLGSVAPTRGPNGLGFGGRVSFGDGAYSFAAIDENNWAISSQSHGTLLWNVATGKTVAVLSCDSDMLDIAFNSDTKLLAGAGRNGVAYVWKIPDLSSPSASPPEIGPMLCLYQSSDNGPWFLWNPQTGYYTCSAGADSNSSSVIGYEISTGDQVNFQPASAMHKTYYQPAFFKDLTLLNFELNQAAKISGLDPLASASKDAKNLPQIDITGLEDSNHLAYKQEDADNSYTVTNDAFLDVDLEPKDSATKVSVIVNNPAKDLTSLDDAEKPIPIGDQLRPGLNFVEVTATNDKGTSKAYALVRVGQDSKPVIGIMHVVTIGASGYAAGSGFEDLGNSTKNDADGVCQFFSSPQQNGFTQADCNLDTPAATTKKSIVDTLNNLNDLAKKNGKEIGPNDNLLVYFSGHGMTDAKGNGYFVPSDGAAETSRDIAWEDVINILRKIHCRNVILIIDACHSGSAAQNAKFDQTGSISHAATDNSQVVVLASSQATKDSYVQGDTSVFTAALLADLKDPTKGVTSQSPGYKDAEVLLQNVRTDVMNKSGAIQRPVLANEDCLQNTVLAKAAAALVYMLTGALAG